MSSEIKNKVCGVIDLAIAIQSGISNIASSIGDINLESFINSDKEGGFAVFEKKTYYWDKNGKPITDWKGHTSMNTKIVDPVYEAAHCLYASRIDIIKDGYFIDTKSPMEPELFIMNELEAFDIDYPWQFNTAEILYNEFNEIQK